MRRKHYSNFAAGQIDALFDHFSRPGAPGVSVLVISNGRVLFAKGYGLANLEQQLPCGLNTNFRLASVTKQFTAMAVMILTKLKKLTLDEPLAEFFPEFPEYGRQITVRHLLSHNSGLLDYEGLIPKATKIPVLDRDVLRLLLEQDRTYFPPGSKFRYSNSAYAVLAQIVEVRSGSTFAHFLKKSIFEPLQMNHTLAYEQGLSVIPNRAHGYSPDGAGFKRADQSLTSSVLGDGGIYSSVADLYRWDQALYSTTLISPKMLDLAFCPATGTDHPGTGYGFGWYIGSYRGLKETWHSGNTIGFTTHLTRFPEKKLTVIVLSNRSEAKIVELVRILADSFLSDCR